MNSILVCRDTQFHWSPRFRIAAHFLLLYAILTQSLLCLRLLQIASFIVSAIAQGRALFLWRRQWLGMSDERRSQSGWQQRAGWFSAFACFGCVAGALAYAARMGNLIHVFTSIKMETSLCISSNSTAQSLLLIEKEYTLPCARFSLLRSKSAPCLVPLFAAKAEILWRKQPSKENNCG